MKPILIIASEKPFQNTLVASDNVVSATRQGYRVASLMNNQAYLENFQRACQSRSGSRVEITGYLFSMGGEGKSLIERHAKINGYDKVVWLHKASHVPSLSSVVARFLTCSHPPAQRLVVDFTGDEEDIVELEKMMEGQPVTIMRLAS